MVGSNEKDVLLDAVFRNVETGLCVLSDVGVVLRANDVWLHSMQLTADVAIGRTLSSIAPERAALIFAAAAAQRSRAGVTLPRRPRAEGGDWEERVTPFDASGGPLLLLSATPAIERTPRASLPALIEKLPIGVFVCERDAIVYANPTFAGYCGRAASELIGHTLEQLAAPGAAKSPEEGKEWEVHGPNGRSVTLACSTVRSIEFEGRQADLWTCRDLSPSKEMQAQLIHTDRLATVGMLAAGVAHEINNPLAFMLVALELIDESLQRVAAGFPASELAETFDSLRDAQVGAQRVKAIVSELKAFSRGDRDEPITLDLRKLLESAIAMATNEIKPRARLVRSFDAAPCVVGNEARLGQVFLNLLVNAAHAIPEGLADDNEIRVVLKTDSQGRAVVEVLDTGTGIAPELLERIFAPFFTTKAGSGTGLGLAISRSTIHALGGEITIENRPDRGAIARVTLLPGRVECQRPAGDPRDAEVSRARQAQVLVVDDEIAICNTFRRLLKGHHVTAESNAREAWARIERGERFDVVFCDVMMPGMSGMELHRHVLGTAPEQAERFVFMTGGTFTQSAEDFLNRVRNPRLDKPFDARQIRQIVTQVDAADAVVRARAESA